MNKNNILNFITKNYIAICGMIFFTFTISYFQYYSYKIHNCDYEIVSCKVYEVVKISKPSGYNVYFKCRINGKVYDDRDKLPNYYEFGFRYFLVGKNVPLLICKSNPKYHDILLLPEDFKERNLVYPDSLKIYLKYLK